MIAPLIHDAGLNVTSSTLVLGVGGIGFGGGELFWCNSVLRL